MNITGQFGVRRGTGLEIVDNSTGAFNIRTSPNMGYSGIKFEGNTNYDYVGFDASRNWTGKRFAIFYYFC